MRKTPIPPKKAPRFQLGQAGEDYLKAIYKLTSGEPVAITALAAALNVSPAAVTKMLRRLSSMGLVSHSRYRHRGVCLTTAGRHIAVEIVRHHRLLELYLSEALGYPLDRVHEEAEILEHAISEDFEDSIDRLLGYPQVDPHGDPIPTRNAGDVPESIGAMLAHAEAGERLVVCRVLDTNVELLRYLVSLGVVPQAMLEVTEKGPPGGTVRVRVCQTGAEHVLRNEAARNVFVNRL